MVSVSVKLVNSCPERLVRCGGRHRDLSFGLVAKAIARRSAVSDAKAIASVMLACRAKRASNWAADGNVRHRNSGSADLVLDVRDARRVDGSDLLELDDAVPDPVEQPLAGAHDHGSDRYVDLVHQSRG